MLRLLPRLLPPLGALLLVLACAPARADDFAERCADRVALERVYHAHRLGAKTPFEQAMPPASIGQLVRQDRHKEAVLAAAYGVEITPAMLAAEVARIDATTRAPEILAELRHALGDDPGRFARGVARPILVERELRRRFEQDDGLHAGTRRAAEAARARLLAGQPGDELQEVTWQLTPRPPADFAAPGPATPPPPTEIKARSGAYTVEATAQLSQPLGSPNASATPGTPDKAWFEDLDPELQNVLRVQLRQPGDVSAVIETPAGFLVFIARSRTAETLAAASFSLPKRSYDEWLARESVPLSAPAP